MEYPIIVSGHADGGIRFWRLIPHRMPKVRRSGQGWKARFCQDQLLTLELVSECDRSHKGAVTCVAFTTDNPPIMHTGDSSGMVVQWGKLSRKWLHREAAWTAEGTDVAQVNDCFLGSIRFVCVRQHYCVCACVLACKLACLLLRLFVCVRA